MMRLSDVVALAKAGYKFSEVKELLTLTEEEEPQTEEATEQTEEEEPQNEETEENDNSAENDDTDYKALYEESQKKLKAAQAANRKEPKEEPKTDEDIALEHLKALLH